MYFLVFCPVFNINLLFWLIGTRYNSSGATKSLEQTLTNLDLEKIRLELDNYKILKMLYDKNLVDMSLRLNRSDSIFRTILELPGIGRRPRKSYDKRLGRNLPIDFMIVRQKQYQTFIIKIFPAVNLNFNLLT